MKIVLRVLIGAAIAAAALGLAILGTYALRVRHFEASPADGYSADFYLYITADAKRMARHDETVTVLVQPNNSGINSDDPNTHRRDAWWTGFERRTVADQLDVVLLVPAFIRPGADWQIYTHALDRDTLLAERADLKRIDLQLIAMIDRARAELATMGIKTDERILIQGFSASGMFANRFTLLHPERVKAASVGSPGGWPIAPITDFNSESLSYPVGISDLESLTDQSFNAAAFNAVPQLIYMGSADDNDSLDYSDGWDKQDSELVERLFGTDPISRWEDARSIYEAEGANVQFLLVDGIGHDRKALQDYSTEFFRKVLNAP